MIIKLTKSTIKGRNDVGRFIKEGVDRASIVENDIYVDDTGDVVKVLHIADDYDRSLVNGKCQEVIVLKSFKTGNVSAISKRKFLRKSKLEDSKVEYRYARLVDGNIRPLLRTIRLLGECDLSSQEDILHHELDGLQEFITRCGDDNKIPRILIDLDCTDAGENISVDNPLYRCHELRSKIYDVLAESVISILSQALKVDVTSEDVLITHNDRFINVYILTDLFKWTRLW